MPDDGSKHLLSMAQQFTGLPMGALISGPLLAAAEANNKMGETQCHYILSSGFTEEGGVFSPRMVTLTLTRSVINEESLPDVKTSSFSTSIEVPLISILPINALGLISVEADFTMTVKSSHSSSQSESDEKSSSSKGTAKFKASAGFGIFKVTVSGSYTSTSSENSKSQSSSSSKQSNEATYSVKVHAGQIPTPAGITTIIDAYTQNISPIQTSGGNGDKG